MGIHDPYWDRTEDEMLRDFYNWDAPQLAGSTLDPLKEKGYLRLNAGTYSDNLVEVRRTTAGDALAAA